MIKRIIYILAAGMVMAACDKAEIQDNSGNQMSGTPFVEGQLVTLSVNAGDQTKVTSTYSGGIASFKWETGDQIKVTVGDKSATFTLSNLIDGGTSAEFKGMMPASGSTFDVQYPTTAPDLTTQTYVENNLPEDKMLFAATNCTLGSNLTLSPQYSALRLNFYGYDRKVTSIVVKNTTADPNETYTLNCTTPVKVGVTEANATPFLMVVPTGTYSFIVQVTADEILPNVDNDTIYKEGVYSAPGVVVTAGNFATLSAKSFSSANVKDMPARSITQIWAPVNCGYDATNHQYGKLYQYGRKVGCGYNDGSYFQEPQIQSYDTTTTDVSEMTDDSKFYMNWRASEWSSSDDPCPSGWRVPTLMELNKLLGGNEITYISASSYTISGFVNYGHWLNGTTTPNKLRPGSSTDYEGVHLISAGARSYENGNAFKRASEGYYWASDRFDSDNSFGAGLNSTWVCAAYNNQAHAFSVRCIYNERKFEIKMGGDVL